MYVVETVWGYWYELHRWAVVAVDLCLLVRYACLKEPSDVCWQVGPEETLLDQGNGGFDPGVGQLLQLGDDLPAQALRDERPCCSQRHLTDNFHAAIGEPDQLERHLVTVVLEEILERCICCLSCCQSWQIRGCGSGNSASERLMVQGNVL